MYAYYTVCIIHTLQKNAPTPAQLLPSFLQLLPSAQLGSLPSLAGKCFYHRLFTPLACLWYFVFQRLNADHTLQAVIADASSGGADAINDKLSQNLVSDSTASWSDARQRTPCELMREALALQGSRICQLGSATLWHGLVVALLDGTTIRLRPHGDIPQHFPPHQNQYRETYWCLMRAVVCFSALAGAALDCVTGSLHLSEQSMACQILLRSTVRALFIGDRNFGIFRVVQSARHAGQEVLMRLTDCRAVKILNRQLKPGDYSVEWKRTCRDHGQRGCSNEPVAGRLIVARVQRPGYRSQLLCLFTSLRDSAQYPVQELVRLYGMRWHAEINLRYLKTQMDMVELDVKSAAMAQKEWLAGLIAYNLIRAAMLCAAATKNISPLTLSFSFARRRLRWWLRHLGCATRPAVEIWHKTLHDIAKNALPSRSKPRPSEPRLQRHLRRPYGPLVGSRTAARKKIQQALAKS